MSRLRLNKIATPSNPASNKAELFYSSTLSPAAPAVIDESGNVCRVGGLTTTDRRLIKRTFLYNGTTSYTPTSGTTALSVECIGGGGQGGGCPASGGANSTSGSGGGGGGGGHLYTTTNVSGAHAGTFAIGAGGSTGGTNAGGQNGGATIFTDSANAVVAQANGGTGGTVGAAAAATLGNTTATTGAGGTASGTPAEGTTGTTWQGEDGAYSLRFVAATVVVGGKGGEAIGRIGGSGAAVLLTSGTGNAGRKYGGGGGGAIDLAAGNAARAGGAGGAGVMIIEEYA